MLLKGGNGNEIDIYEAHHTIAISAEVLLVGEHKLLVGQGHVADSGPKTRPTPDGKQPPTDVSPVVALKHAHPLRCSVCATKPARRSTGTASAALLVLGRPVVFLAALMQPHQAR